MFFYTGSLLKKINLFILFIYFWLHWVFVAVCRLSLLVASGGLLFVVVRRLLIVVASLVAEHTGSRCVGFSGCGSRALERRLSSCGIRA